MRLGGPLRHQLWRVQEKKKNTPCSSSALPDIVVDAILKNNNQVLTAPKLGVQMECSRLSSGLTGLGSEVTATGSLKKATMCGYGGASDVEHEFKPVNAVTVDTHGGGGRCCPPFCVLVS